MTSKAFVLFAFSASLFVFTQARPGIYRQDVGDDCVWPWCKFCPNEYLGLLCKLCPAKTTTAASQEVTTAISNDATTPAPKDKTTPDVEVSTNLPETEEPKFREIRSIKNFTWPWCKFCDDGFDLGFLCQLCNCTIQPQASTPAPELPTENPVSEENSFQKSHQALVAKRELIKHLTDCDWPWCKFCPDERLGFLCKLCPMKTTPAPVEITTQENVVPSEQPTEEAETKEHHFSSNVEKEKDFPWCKFCDEGFDLGFLCKLCNCTSGSTTKTPELPTEQPVDGTTKKVLVKNVIKPDYRKDVFQRVRFGNMVQHFQKIQGDNKNQVLV